MIHPTAVVSPEARVAADVAIGPYAIVEAGVTIGTGCVLHAHCILRAGTELADGVVVHGCAVIGGPPQSLTFDLATPSGVRVGARTVIRESATINRASRAGGVTEIGADCFLMGAAHVGHDAQVAERVIIGHAALLGGHVEIGPHVFLGGGAGVHQFCRIGEGAILAGQVTTTLDLPPFVMSGARNRVHGLNLVGMKRRGFAREVIAEVKMLFNRVYGARNPRAEATAALAAGAAHSAPGRTFLAFFAGGGRGVARPQRGAALDGDAPASDA